MATILLAPLLALVYGAVSQGVPAIVAALSEPDVLHAFWQTMVISVVVLIVHGVFGTLTAWVLVRHQFRGRMLLNRSIDLPFAVSPVIVGFMVIVLFGRRGLLSPLTEALGITIVFAIPGMIIVTLFVTLPLMIRELLPVLEAFGQDQENAAATLGANGWDTFRLVTFPALRLAFFYGLGLTLARAIGEFGAILVVSGGIQGRTETATIYIFRALDDRQYAGAYSAALVLGLVSLVLVFGIELMQRRHTHHKN